MKYLKKIANEDYIEIENNDNKFDNREVARAIRDSLIMEEEATNAYEYYADKIKDEKIKAVFQSIADEERVHVGEFQKLLEVLLHDEEKMIDDGKKEVEDING